MTEGNEHYRKTVTAPRETHFVRCGYTDRFDPFRLSHLPRLRALYEGLFNEFLGEAPVDRLLDIGCGTGIYVEALAAHAHRLCALDASPEMTTVARAFCKERGLEHVHHIVGSAEVLPFADNTFDLVVALDTLHHVGSLEDVVAEVFRLLKPGGRFLVFEPNILNPLMWLAHAIPREERLALGRNRPASLRAALEQRFITLRWQGVCALVTETQGMRRRALDACIAMFRWINRESLYPRQVWLGIKPERK